MPGRVPQRRGRTTEIEDDDNEDSAPESSASFVSNGSKRQRITNGQSEVSLQRKRCDSQTSEILLCLDTRLLMYYLRTVP